MKRFRLLALLPCLAAGLVTTSARATTVNGIAYCNLSSSDANNTPAPGSGHTGTECATFTSSAISFNNSGANTIGSFLNSGSLIGSVSYLNGFTASSSLDTSLFIFTGTAQFTQGQTYSATHDDGTVMTVGGTTVVSSPAPTSPITTYFTFAGATGAYDFQYDYTEAWGGSTYVTDATMSPVSDVPEPESLALCGTGMLLLFGLLRRQSEVRRPGRMEAV